MWFVLSLVKRYYMRQFSLFAWTHVALLIVVTQSYLIIQVKNNVTVFIGRLSGIGEKLLDFIFFQDHFLNDLYFFQNLFEGLIWYILPIMMIVVNDIMAYMFGFFMGKTRLIQVKINKELRDMHKDIWGQSTLGKVHKK